MQVLEREALAAAAVSPTRIPVRRYDEAAVPSPGAENTTRHPEHRIHIAVTHTRVLEPARGAAAQTQRRARCVKEFLPSRPTRGLGSSLRTAACVDRVRDTRTRHLDREMWPFDCCPGPANTSAARRRQLGKQFLLQRRRSASSRPSPLRRRTASSARTPASRTASRASRHRNLRSGPVQRALRLTGCAPPRRATHAPAAPRATETILISADACCVLRIMAQACSCRRRNKPGTACDD